MKLIKRVFLLGLVGLLLNACSAGVAAAGGVQTAAPVASALPTATVTAPTLPPTRIPTRSAPTAIPTSTPTTPPTSELVLVKQGPGRLVCPILLYHHVAVSDHDSQYYVTPQEFQQQMQALKDWGYTSISPTLLVKAINFGAKLPERPVVISFDDGDASVFTQAYPVMKALGFTGVNYLVYNYVGADGYMTVSQLQELSAAGWETGSHSMTHSDLTTSQRVEWEVTQSRASLEALLGVPVQTFAYPFGIKNAEAVRLVKDVYRAGMGLGSFLEQGPGNLFYLWRRPVLGGWDLKTFGSFLPWNTPPGG